MLTSKRDCPALLSPQIGGGRTGATAPRLVWLNEPDRERLNAFVSSSPLAHYKQVFGWGEVVAYEGTRPIRLGVERAGNLSASLTAYVRRLPGLPLTFLNGSRGPILDPNDHESLQCLVDGVRRVAREHRAIFLRIDPELPEDDRAARATMVKAGFRHLAVKNWSDLNDPRIVMCLDISVPESELLRHMRETHRRHIRGAAKRGVRIRFARDQEDVVRLRELMLDLGEHRGFPVRSLEYYLRIWTHFLQRGHGTLLLAEKGSDVLACLLILTLGSKAWLLYTCLAPSGRALHPNEALWWEALRMAKGQGVTQFNFGGSGTDWPPTQDSPGHSIYAFKHGFGSTAVYLTGYYDLVFRPTLYRLFRLAEERMLPRIATSTLLRRLSRT